MSSVSCWWCFSTSGMVGLGPCGCQEWDPFSGVWSSQLGISHCYLVVDFRKNLSGSSRCDGLCHYDLVFSFGIFAQ